VVLVTWKRAEDGDGTVLRFVEVGGKETTAEVQVPLLNVRSAWRCDAFERKQEAVSTSAHGFKFSAKPFQIVTVRLEGEPALK
jgi:alpha-mannosidase